MKSRRQQDEHVLSVHRLPAPYFLVMADERSIYEGHEEKVAIETLYRVARAGAYSVTCFIDGVEVIHSRAVASG